MLIAATTWIRFDKDEITDIEVRVDSRNNVVSELQASGR